MAPSSSTLVVDPGSNQATVTNIPVGSRREVREDSNQLQIQAGTLSSPVVNNELSITGPNSILSPLPNQGNNLRTGNTNVPNSSVSPEGGCPVNLGETSQRNLDGSITANPPAVTADVNVATSSHDAPPPLSSPIAHVGPSRVNEGHVRTERTDAFSNAFGGLSDPPISEIQTRGGNPVETPASMDDKSVQSVARSTTYVDWNQSPVYSDLPNASGVVLRQ